jgi:hypothetical protein
MRLTVVIAGLDTLSLKARYMIQAAQTGLKLSASEAAAILVEEAKTLVPVETGNLRDHIHAEPFDDTPDRQTYQVMPFDEAGNKYGFDPAYARRIEYGFIGTDSAGRHYHQAAQPYMRPAVDSKGQEALDAIKTGIEESVFEAMGRQ